MPLAEKGAVSAGHGIEATGAAAKIKQRARVGRRSSGAYRVDTRAHRRNLGPIEEVKAFCKQFQLHVLSKTEASRDTHVQVPDIRLLEEIAGHQRETGCASRSINAASLRWCVWSKPEIITCSSCTTARTHGAGNGSGEALSREGVKDRRNCPAIEYRSTCVTAALEVCVVDNAGFKLLSSIKSLQTVFSLLVEGVER